MRRLVYSNDDHLVYKHAQFNQGPDTESASGFVDLRAVMCLSALHLKRFRWRTLLRLLAPVILPLFKKRSGRYRKVDTSFPDSIHHKFTVP